MISFYIVVYILTPMKNLLWSIDLEEKPAVQYIGPGISEEHNNRIYCLPNLWCVHLYNFKGTLTLEEGCLDVHPGDIGFIPPGKTVTYAVYGTGVHMACHFRMKEGLSQARTLPSMMPSGARYSAISDSFQDVLHLHETHPLAADVKLWSLLLDAERAWKQLCQTENRTHPSLEKSIRHIELNLGGSLSVAELVKQSGVSHPSLVRLFKQHLNCTITQYIRKRRMAKARHLLTETNQPVKSVAIDCGFTDLQYFNKCVRNAYGFSPRALRR